MPNQYTSGNVKPKRQIIIPIGPSIAYIPLTRENFALIDYCDAEKVSPHNWQSASNPRARSMYPVTIIEGKTVSLAAFLLNLRGREISADHVLPRNSLDNRRVNIRPADKFQQAWNKPLTSRNTSGFKGVSLRKDSGKWRARIRNKNVLILLGQYTTAQGASAVYAIAAEEMHGQFARSA